METSIRNEHKSDSNMTQAVIMGPVGGVGLLALWVIGVACLAAAGAVPVVNVVAGFIFWCLGWLGHQIPWTTTQLLWVYVALVPLLSCTAIVDELVRKRKVRLANSKSIEIEVQPAFTFSTIPILIMVLISLAIVLSDIATRTHG